MPPHQPPLSPSQWAATHGNNMSVYDALYKYDGEYVGNYNDQFAEGWDVLQQDIYDNQLALEVIPANTQLTPRPNGTATYANGKLDKSQDIPAWDDNEQYADDGYRDLMVKQMRNYARFLEYTDREVGRVVDAIDDLGEKENTLIIYIVGDNGASAEGGLDGTCNELINLNGLEPTQQENLACAERWGDETTSPHYAVGWAWALDSPFRWTKQVGSYFGGIRNPMVISWPEKITEDMVVSNNLRDQFHPCD